MTKATHFSAALVLALAFGLVACASDDGPRLETDPPQSPPHIPLHGKGRRTPMCTWSALTKTATKYSGTAR